MRIVPKYEVIMREVDNSIISLGLFDSYGEAHDAAILHASAKLPTEVTKAFQITKVYINEATYTE